MRFLYLLFLAFQISSAQTLLSESSQAVRMDKFIGFDNYESLYFLQNRALHKTGTEGNFVYNSLQLGKITAVDIINPLKIVVFFQDTNTVVLLDNKLNEIDRIKFDLINPSMNIGSATTAGSNSLWVFNMDTQQLELYNYKARTATTVSQPFPGQLISQASNFNYCFVLTPKKLRAFNVYGSFLNQLDLQGFERVAEAHENVLLLKDNKLHFIADFVKAKSKTAGDIVVLDTSEILIRDYQLMKDFIYIFDGKELHTFKLTIPKKD